MSREGLVLPGEELAVEEEAIPAQGGYVDSRGIVRAFTPGLKVFDKYKKIVYVKTFKNPEAVKQGLIVEARVEAVLDDIAFLKIYDAGGRRVELPGVLYIAQASSTLIQSLLDVVKPGDHVKARVLNNNIPYQLSIKEPGLGVIEAYCSICGGLLYKSNDKLVCKTCGNIERRKISQDYLHTLG
ncbi:MAG: exosome complex RNA-binding protein Csl4 [Desulfurococcus sp.]|nr:exosome complex RNA-binding protein Csl4 [Desulfurococcus sp.]